jgi:chromosome partitioning protein
MERNKMQTIAIVNEKGGTGKTTTAVNLAAALGEMGESVLLVDLDGQAASSRWLGVEDDVRLANALLRGGGLEPIGDVAPGLSLAPGSGKLDSVAHDLRPTQGGQLRRVLAEVADQFNYILIDCPPSLGNRLIGNALLASGQAIAPVEPSILALDGLGILLTTLQDIREGFGHNIVLLGALACRYDARTRLSRLVLAELKRALPGRVFNTVIRETVRMQECPASGMSIHRYAPESLAAKDYMALAKELLSKSALSAGMEVSAEDLAKEDELNETEQEALHHFRQNAVSMFTTPKKTKGPRVEQTETEDQDASRDADWDEQYAEPQDEQEPSPVAVQFDRADDNEPVEADADDAYGEPIPIAVVGAARNDSGDEQPEGSADEQAGLEDTRDSSADEPAEETQSEPQPVPVDPPAEPATTSLASSKVFGEDDVVDALYADGAMVEIEPDYPQSESEELVEAASTSDADATSDRISGDEAKALAAQAAADRDAEERSLAGSGDASSGMVRKIMTAASPLILVGLLAVGWMALSGSRSTPRTASARVGVTAEGIAPFAAADRPVATLEPVADVAGESPPGAPADAAPDVEEPASVEPSADEAAPAVAENAPAAPVEPAADSVPAVGEGTIALAATTTRPAEDEAAAPTTQPAIEYIPCPPGYKLTCVMKSPSGFVAMVNGKTTRTGQRIDGATVLDISLKAVEMELDGKRFSLGIGQKTVVGETETTEE